MFLSRITSLGSSLFSKIWKGSLKNELTSKLSWRIRARVIGPCMTVGGSAGTSEGVMSSSVHELAPSTCVLLLSKNFDRSPFFNVAPSLSMSTFYFSSMMHLYIFVPTSPPLSSISIKGVLLIDTKDCIGVDGWHLNLAFWWTLPNMLEWHHL